MKAEELRTKSVDELKKMLLDLRREQFNMRFQKASGELGKQTAQIRFLRRDIARIKTILTETNKTKDAKAA